MHPADHFIGDILIIEVGHEEMRIALDADIRQDDDLHIAAVLFHDFGPFVREVQAHTPVVETPMRVRRAASLDVVAKLDDHRNF